MSCYISSGYTLDCRNASTGGLKEIYILGDAGNSISGYTSNGDDQVLSASGAGTFYKFELTKQGSSLTENISVNTTSQSVVFEHTVVMNLPKLNNTLRNVFQELVSQQNIVMICLDNNDRYWAVGWTNGMLVTAGGIQSGLAYNDLNGLNALTIVGGEPNAIQEIVVSTTLAAVFTGITVQS